MSRFATILKRGTVMKNKFVSILAKLLCVVLVLGILAACGDAGGDSSSVADGSAAASSGATSSKTSSVIANTKYTAEQQASFEQFGHYGNVTVKDYEILEGERDPWMWPFPRNSIWNMPIGSDAELVDSAWEFGDLLLIDKEYFLTTSESDPVMDIYITGMNNRWPSDLSTLTKASFTTYWPKGVTISKDLQGNECTTILQPDGRTIIQMQPTCRDTLDSTYITGHPGHAVDLYNDDGAYGSHWGSALSAIGGSLRYGELTSDEPIRHALKIDVSQACLYFDWKTMGFRWPAITADGHAQTGGYTSSNPNHLMGSLLCLPKDVTVESLGIQTEVGKKLFWTLQNYGCYVVDCAGNDNNRNLFNLCGDELIIDEVRKEYNITISGIRYKGAVTSADKAYVEDYKRIIENLKIVVNNSKNTVGGGGTPCQPLAPHLPSIK